MNNSDISQIQNRGIFKYGTAPEWLDLAATLPTPPMLYGPLFRQNELSLLFADMGAGKTIFGYQIAQKIATGKSGNKYIPDSEPQKALYFDFELQIKQFEVRFKNKEGHVFPLSDNIIRVELDLTESDLNQSLEDQVFNQIKTLVNELNIKILIIDNITYISDTSDFRTALKFMQKLRIFKNQFDLSILVVGHTPKRNLDEPLTENSLAGSKNLMNLADSSFAIGKSAKGHQYRYIKQIKVRWTSFEFHKENVLDCEIGVENGFTQFFFNGTCNENEHLKKINPLDGRNENILEMSKAGKTQKEISETFGITDRQVRNILKNANNELPF